VTADSVQWKQSTHCTHEHGFTAVYGGLRRVYGADGLARSSACRVSSATRRATRRSQRKRCLVCSRGMQSISIRLSKELMEASKPMAAQHGVG